MQNSEFVKFSLCQASVSKGVRNKTQPYVAISLKKVPAQDLNIPQNNDNSAAEEESKTQDGAKGTNLVKIVFESKDQQVKWFNALNDAVKVANVQTNRRHRTEVLAQNSTSRAVDQLGGDLQQAN